MLTVGKYNYPNLITFAEALKITQLAITKFEGKMSNKDVAEALGYKIKDPDAISGYIFRKFDDVASYGLMKRQRGFMKVTEVATQALDPYDALNAKEGRVKALRGIPVVWEAYSEWNGVIPPDTALPSKLVDLLGVTWQEAQKHAEPLRKLFTEVFPHLTVPETSRLQTTDASGGVVGGKGSQQTGTLTISATGKSFGFTKTLSFTRKGIEELKKLIAFLESQAEENETEPENQDSKA